MFVSRGLKHKNFSTTNLFGPNEYYSTNSIEQINEKFLCSNFFLNSARSSTEWTKQLIYPKLLTCYRKNQSLKLNIIKVLLSTNKTTVTFTITLTNIKFS